ncbi:hypothetical protein HDU97_009399, partial [Phlyctochytrium planicorne]
MAKCKTLQQLEDTCNDVIKFASDTTILTVQANHGKVSPAASTKNAKNAKTRGQGFTTPHAKTNNRKEQTELDAVDRWVNDAQPGSNNDATHALHDCTFEDDHYGDIIFPDDDEEYNSDDDEDDDEAGDHENIDAKASADTDSDDDDNSSKTNSEINWSDREEQEQMPTKTTTRSGRTSKPPPPRFAMNAEILQYYPFQHHPSQWYFPAFHTIFDPTSLPDPRTLKEALKRPDGTQWYEAARKEMQSLLDRAVYKLVKKPERQN